MSGLGEVTDAEVAALLNSLPTAFAGVSHGTSESGSGLGCWDGPPCSCSDFYSSPRIVLT